MALPEMQKGRAVCRSRGCSTPAPPFLASSGAPCQMPAGINAGRLKRLAGRKARLSASAPGAAIGTADFAGRRRRMMSSRLRELRAGVLLHGLLQDLLEVDHRLGA